MSVDVFLASLGPCLIARHLYILICVRKMFKLARRHVIRVVVLFSILFCCVLSLVCLSVCLLFLCVCACLLVIWDVGICACGDFGFWDFGICGC